MINVETKNGDIAMSLDEYSRWACLIEAFHFLEQKAEELKVDLDALIKPKAIEYYVEERFLSMRHDVGVEHDLGNI